MNVFAFFEFGDVSTARWQGVQRCWALFGLLLILATWRLWTPQTIYPQVPLLRIGGELPSACQWAALVAAIVVLATLLSPWPRIKHVAKARMFLVFIIAMALFFLTDQHRLQPWAYQLTIYAIVFGTVSDSPKTRARGFALLRILTVSIYLFSSLGKFDFQFLHTVGQQFLDVLFGFVGVEVQPWPLLTRLVMAGAFPLVELLIVIALTLPRLRRAGVWIAVIMHGSLLLVLGPFGLGHETGVLIWNLFFITQLVFLFSGQTQPSTLVQESESAEPARLGRISTYVVAAAVCLPLLEPIGWFDHWPAWGLYSPRNSRVLVEVHRAELTSLPAELQPYLSKTNSDIGWVPLNIDQWSLGSLSVPIYPQARFQLGVAESIATRYALDRTIRVRLLGMSNRMTGVRPIETLTGCQQIVAAANRFRLNSRPNEDGEPRSAQP